MGSPRVEEILEALQWLALTLGEQRKTPPPVLTPLSEAETGAVRAALEAAEMGTDVASLFELERIVEELLQSPADRKRGRIAPEANLPPILEILRRDPYALFGFRVRLKFLRWLRYEAGDRDARKALRLLMRPRSENPDPRRELAATRASMRVEGFTEAGMTKREAVRAVAEGRPGPVPARLQRDHGYPATFPPLKPTSIGLILSLLRERDREFRVPPQRAPHKRPGRNKRETPGNPVYSGPKAAQKAGLSTLPLGETTAAERGRHDELPHDNRSRRPAQGAAPNPPGVEAQRKGAAILKAVRKPRSVRGGGAVAVPRGTDVRSHGRGDGSARKRPGRVKGPP